MPIQSYFRVSRKNKATRRLSLASAQTHDKYTVGLFTCLNTTYVCRTRTEVALASNALYERHLEKDIYVYESKSAAGCCSLAMGSYEKWG